MGVVPPSPLPVSVCEAEGVFAAEGVLARDASQAIRPTAPIATAPMAIFSPSLIFVSFFTP